MNETLRKAHQKRSIATRINPVQRFWKLFPEMLKMKEQAQVEPTGLNFALALSQTRLSEYNVSQMSAQKDETLKFFNRSHHHRAIGHILIISMLQAMLNEDEMAVGVPQPDVLAQLHSISKNTFFAIINDAVAMGYVIRLPASYDKRNKILICHPKTLLSYLSNAAAWSETTINCNLPEATANVLARKIKLGLNEPLDHTVEGLYKLFHKGEFLDLKNYVTTEFNRSRK